MMKGWELIWWCIQGISGILIAVVVCYAIVWVLFEWPWLNLAIPLFGYFIYKKLGSDGDTSWLKYLRKEFYKRK